MHAIDGVGAEGQVAVDRQRADGRAVVARGDHGGGVERGGAQLADAGQHDFAADIDRAVQLAVDFQRAVGDQDGAAQPAAVAGQDQRSRAGLDEALRALQRVVDGVDELARGVGAVADHQGRRVAAAADQGDGRALHGVAVGGELDARDAHRAGAAIDGDRAGRAGEDGIATVGQGAGGVGGAVPVAAGGAPGAVAAAGARGGRRAVAVPQVGGARAEDEVDLLVAGQRLDGRRGLRVAGDGAQRQAVAAQGAAVRQDAVVAGVGAQGVDRHVQGRVVQRDVAADRDVVAGAGLRDGQAGVAGLEIEHGVVHRQVAPDDEVAVGHAGRRADGVTGGDARARYVEVAVDGAEARDGAVGGRVDVAGEGDAGAAAVAADHQGAAVDVNAAGEGGRAVEHLRVAGRHRQVGGHRGAAGGTQCDRGRQPLVGAVFQDWGPFCLGPRSGCHAESPAEIVFPFAEIFCMDWSGRWKKDAIYTRFFAN
ncbi:Uncharacterised protein [Achromobacter sp. 2789STDY5608615]|nr:Uncharacterised protein [Achromobacter sp. 2789STDY5608615]